LKGWHYKQLYSNKTAKAYHNNNNISVKHGLQNALHKRWGLNLYYLFEEQEKITNVQTGFNILNLNFGQNNLKFEHFNPHHRQDFRILHC